MWYKTCSWLELWFLSVRRIDSTKTCQISTPFIWLYSYRASHAAKSEDIRGETKSLELRRLFHCAAYNALIAIITCTQTEIKFYNGFLFSENPAKVRHSTISYNTSASGIQKNIALLHPIPNKPEGRAGYRMQKCYVFLFSTNMHMIMNFPSSKLDIVQCAELKQCSTQGVIWAMQYRPCS